MYTLLIDDDEESQSLLAGLLPDGMRLVQLPDTESGLARAREALPSLIVLCTDIKRGWRTCSRLRREDNLKDIPLIVISAQATDAQFDQHRGLKMAANSYLHKPLAVGALSHALADLVGIRLPVPSALDANTEPNPTGIIGEDDIGPEIIDDGATVAFAMPDFEQSAEAVVQAEFTETLASVEAERDGYAQQVRTLTIERDELRGEVIKLTERLANVKRSQERVERAFDRERQAFRREIETLREGGDAPNLELEEKLNKVRALYTDLRDSFESVAEHLQRPLEIIDRHREMAAEVSQVMIPGSDLDIDLLDDLFEEHSNF